jgi:hypothetical protein
MASSSDDLMFGGRVVAAADKACTVQDSGVSTVSGCVGVNNGEACEAPTGSNSCLPSALHQLECENPLRFVWCDRASCSSLPSLLSTYNRCPRQTR